MIAFGKIREEAMSNFIKIGASACLLGEQVRWNGVGALDKYITETLGNYFEFTPICPEVGCGMPIPREPVRLVGDPENPRIVGRKSGEDWSSRMRAWGKQTLDDLEKRNLCGFIFKAKSPSSGPFRIKVYPEEGGQPVSYSGVGFFARMFMDRFPLLPIEDDGRLHDPRLRENFIERVFVFRRWRDMLTDGPTMGGLVNFHTRHKMLIRSHDVQSYRELGKLVAEGKRLGLPALLDKYLTVLTRTLTLKTTPKKHADVLQHIMGHFKKQLSGDEKLELLEIIANYKDGLVPLIVPVTLLNHFVRKYGNEYLAAQHYLNPHPLELKLRNHA